MPTPPISTHRDEAILTGAYEGQARQIGGIELVWVPPGPFLMGASQEPDHPLYDPDALDHELPGGQVVLTRGYWIGRFPLLNREYQLYLDAEPGKSTEPAYWKSSKFKNKDKPLVGISWPEAVEYCAWLTAEGLRSGALEPGWELRLPTEDEWERAARGTDGRKYPWGHEAPDERRAVCDLKASGSPGIVGGRAEGRSPVNCYDMAGNVWELCYGGLAGGRLHDDTAAPLACVARGGCWRSAPEALRCSSRVKVDPEDRDQYQGFRVVCAPRDPAS